VYIKLKIIHLGEIKMSKKTFELITIITGAVSAVAIGIVSYLQLPNAVAINDSIQIAETAIVAICGNFAINNVNKLQKK
jgi:transcription termination factor NusB